MSNMLKAIMEKNRGGYDGNAKTEKMMGQISSLNWRDNIEKTPFHQILEGVEELLKKINQLNLKI